MRELLWKRGKAALGPFIKCPHPEMIEACALAGFDLAVVDMEHTPLSPRDVYPLLLAAQARNMDLIVRVPDASEPYLKWCLDLGVPYIQVPHVGSAADAEHAVRLSRFHPDGERGLCRFVRAADFSSTGRDAYLATANQRTQLIMQVEGKAGLDNIESIAAVAGVGMIFVGPYDLSQSLGLPGRIWDDKVVRAVEHIVAVCKQHDVAVGTFTDTPEGVAHWKKLGMGLIEYASDLALFLQGSKTVLAP